MPGGLQRDGCCTPGSRGLGDQWVPSSGPSTQGLGWGGPRGTQPVPAGGWLLPPSQPPAWRGEMAGEGKATGQSLPSTSQNWALRVKRRVPLLQPVGSQGTRAQGSNNKRQVPAVAEGRGVVSCWRWSHSEPGGRSRQLPQRARSRTPQLPAALTLLTHPTNVQNTRCRGFSLAAVHTTPISAVFPASQGVQLRCPGS